MNVRVLTIFPSVRDIKGVLNNTRVVFDRLHHTSVSTWSPELEHGKFQKLLHNLTSIKIRGTYSERSMLLHF